jgi:hypothetical protein
MLQWYLTLEYSRKIGALLEDPPYRGLASDPTEAVKRKTILLLKKSSLAEEVCKRLCPAGSRPPRLYGLPKIHKEGVPLRPIVSKIGACSYQLTKFLAGILSPLVGCSIHNMKNSIEFVHTLSTLRVGPEDLMVSFDVVSLFTRLPIVESLNLLRKHFSEDILPYLGMSLLPHTSPLDLNPGSHHHPSNKQAILATLVHRARALCDKESLHGELEFLKTTFKENGYSRQ